jgi:hypothetical protein
LCCSISKPHLCVSIQLLFLLLPDSRYPVIKPASSYPKNEETIVKTLGYNKTQTLLLSAPPYVFAAILGITNSWHSDKTRERWLHVVWPQVSCSVGLIISATTLNVGVRYTATFMMMSVYGSFGCILSWVSYTLPRPSSKRAIAYAVVNAGSHLASIYASCESYQGTDSTDREFPKGSSTVVCTLTILTSITC